MPKAGFEPQTLGVASSDGDHNYATPTLIDYICYIIAN